MGNSMLVLMCDDEGSRDKGWPIALFHTRPAHKVLLNYVDAESVADIKEMFAHGILWFKRTTNFNL